MRLHTLAAVCALLVAAASVGTVAAPLEASHVAGVPEAAAYDERAPAPLPVLDSRSAVALGTRLLGLLQRQGSVDGDALPAGASRRDRSRSSYAAQVTQQIRDGRQGRRRRQVDGAKRQRRRGTCATKKSNAASSSSAKPSSTKSSSASSGNKATPTSSSAKPASTTNSSATKNKLVSAGYWADWTSGTLAPEKIDWTKFDFINFAFATPQSDGSIKFSDGDRSTSLLKRLIGSAHANGKKVVLSLGGWGNSNGFSGAVSSQSVRASFIKNVQSLQKQYDLDGFDFDWEYPNNVQGGPTNPSDTKNFQSFLVELRQALGSKPILAAAVPHLPWLTAAGSPVNNVSRAASALDYITLMNYDVWGSSSNPGPNAPLANLCGNSTQPAASAAAGVKQWAAAGMPRSKIILGIAGYGYINTSTKKTLRQRSSDAAQSIANDSERLISPWSVRAEPQRDPRYRAVEHAKRAQLVGLSGSSSDGQINFKQLVDQGALKVKSDGTYGAGSGWTMYWDDCSDTPFLSNGNKVVTYDDTYSLYDKGSFAKQAGIAGVNMWSVDGDTSNWALMNAARSGMGLQ